MSDGIMVKVVESASAERVLDIKTFLMGERSSGSFSTVEFRTAAGVSGT